MQNIVIYFPEIEAFARDENTVTPNITSAKTFSSWYDAKAFAKNFPPCFGEVMVIAWSEVRYEHISS